MQGISELDDNVHLRNIVGLESQQSDRPFKEEDQELFSASNSNTRKKEMIFF